MKYLITTIAALVLVGCGEPQQTTHPQTETKPATLADVAKSEPPTAKGTNYSGKYTLNVPKKVGDLIFELKPDGSFLGKDFVVRNGKALTNPDERSSMDNSIKGHKKIRREDPERAATVTDEIIKNTYRTLMTQGQRGCYIYCVDKETLAHFKNATGKIE